MNWNEHKINSWLDFIQVLEKAGGVYWKASMWSFRGQSNKSWKLTPSLLRKFRENNVTDVKFAQVLERNIIREFITKYPVYSAKDNVHFSNYDLLRWLTIMQHYGCPTRLLDWSDSPYIALYFACKGSRNEDGVVYCMSDYVYTSKVEEEQGKMKSYSEEELLWNNSKSIVFHTITHFQNIRCLTQKGTFTFSTNLYSDHDENIARVLDVPLKAGSLKIKLIIPKELKIEFLSRLYSMGISTESLFPGLDAFCNSFNDLIDFRASEEMEWIKQGKIKSDDSTKIL